MPSEWPFMAVEARSARIEELRRLFHRPRGQYSGADADGDSWNFAVLRQPLADRRLTAAAASELASAIPLQIRPRRSALPYPSRANALAGHSPGGIWPGCRPNAVTVVDPFQAVKVQQEDGERTPGAARSLDFGIHHIDQRAVVGHPVENRSQRVGGPDQKAWRYNPAKRHPTRAHNC